MRYLLLSIRPIAEDLAGTLAFYLLFLLTGSARLSAMVGLGLGLVQVTSYLLRRKRPPALLLLGLALTIGLGGMTMVTNNPRFLLLKPSIIYAVVGATMLPRGWILRYAPPIAHDLLPAATFDRVGWSWAALMFATAVANVLLVAALPPVRAAGLLAMGAAGSKLLLFALQYRVLSRRARAAFSAQRANISHAGEIVNQR